MNSPNTNVDTGVNAGVNVDTCVNVDTNVNADTSINPIANYNINITRNSVSTKLRHNFKPNIGSKKRPMEKSSPTPTKVENFEQVPMFDRWADGI